MGFFSKLSHHCFTLGAHFLRIVIFFSRTMDLRSDTGEQSDILTSTMKSVQRVLSFCPPEILHGNANGYSSNGQLLAPVGVDPSRVSLLRKVHVVYALDGDCY